MKASGLILGVLALICSVMMANCQTPAKRLLDARENEKDSLIEVEKNEVTYEEDFEKFKSVSTARIHSFNETVEGYKEGLNEQLFADKSANAQSAFLLEKRLDELLLRLENYEDSDPEQWSKFKTNFNNDLDSLGQQIRALTEN